MPDYHVNPETGKGGRCRAKIRCDFDLPADEHYGSIQEAEEAWALNVHGSAGVTQGVRKSTGGGSAPSAPILYNPGGANDGEGRLQHRAPVDDGYARPAHDLTGLYPHDVRAYPEEYGAANDETVQQLRKIWELGPATEVTVYRGVPRGVEAFRHGDWVALSRDYALEESYGTGPHGEDGVVIATQVPAEALFNDGSSLEEWGLDASKLPTAMTVDPSGAASASASATSEPQRPEPPTREAVKALEKTLEERHPGVTLSLTQSGGYAVLNAIVLPPEARGQGQGSQVMEELVREADERGWSLALTPSKDYGASSVARLKKFYKGFGFQENKGVHRDHATREAMVRHAQPVV